MPATVKNGKASKAGEDREVEEDVGTILPPGGESAFVITPQSTSSTHGTCLRNLTVWWNPCSLLTYWLTICQSTLLVDTEHLDVDMQVE